MRVAIVHHWFVTLGGGERVAEALAGIFPEADLFSLVVDRSTLPQGLRNREIRTSILQGVPGAKKIHRHLLPLYPLAVEQLDLTGYDLVLTSDSGPMKGVITSPESTHVCYCHSPMRALWDGYQPHFASTSAVARLPFMLAAHYVRNWDYMAAQRVNHFIANSKYVAGRIKRYYGRESAVIHPPVETARGYIAENTGDYYLAAGRQVGYKRTELIIEACNRLRRPLVVVGMGPEYKRLKKLAGPTVRFAGLVSDRELWEMYSQCRALLFAADEDFGIVPLEAQACGRPVIAFGKGGSLETVVGIRSDVAYGFEGQPTGVFFKEQSVDSLCDAIRLFEQHEQAFSPSRIRQHALQFDTDIFLDRVRDFLEIRDISTHGLGRPSIRLPEAELVGGQR